MKTKILPPLDYLNECFDVISDNLVWKARPLRHFVNQRGWKIWNTRFTGTIAGTLGSRGYRYVGIDKQIYSTHRILFYIHHGYCLEEIDHMDGNTSNNAISNLRPATQSQNMANSRIRKNNTSGIKGVYWFKRDQKWYASIKVRGEPMYLGCFDNKEAAAAAYEKAAIQYFGEFARTSCA